VGESDRLIELDRATGAQRSDVDFDLGWGPEPKIAGDRLFFVEGFDTLRACELATGRVVWKHELGDSTRIWHADEQRVLAASEDTFGAFDARTGIPLWQVRHRTSQVAALPDRVAVQISDGQLVVYRLADGRVLGRATSSAGAEPLAHGNALFSIVTGQLHELDSFGSVRRRARLPLAQPHWALQRLPARALLVTDYDARFTDAGALVALDPGDLSVLWRLERAVVFEATSQLVLTADGWGCGGGRPPLAARDATSGRVLWSHPWCHWVSSLAADDGIIVSFSRDSATAWDPATGAVRWTVPVDS
jgi:outer membrane protein assembly factor BamB